MSQVSQKRNPSLVFWLTWVIYIHAYALFYLNTQHVENIISKDEQAGQLYYAATEVCRDISCKSWSMKRIREHDSDKYNLEVTLRIENKNKRKPNTEKIRRNIVAAINTLPWYAKSKFSGEVTVNIDRVFKSRERK